MYFNFIDAILLYSGHQHVQAVQRPNYNIAEQYGLYLYLLCTSLHICICYVRHSTYVSAMYITPHIYLLCTSLHTYICYVHHSTHISAMYITPHIHLLCTSYVSAMYITPHRTLEVPSPTEPTIIFLQTEHLTSPCQMGDWTATA